MNSNKDTIKVLLCEAGKCARLIEISDELDAFQKIVGGMIEEYMPFEDDAVIVCNEDGRSRGLSPNRAILGEDGKIIDVIHGDFFICYGPFESERYLSLPDDLADKYQEMFKWPEQIFMKNGKGDSSHKYNPDYRNQQVLDLKPRITKSHKNKKETPVDKEENSYEL